MSTLRYRLPRAVVVITGTIRRTFDEDKDKGQGKSLATMPPILVSHAVELRHVGDGGDPRTVDLPSGWLRSYKGSFAFSEDLRLTKATMETTGEVGTLISSGASIAGFVAGGFVGALAEAKDASKQTYEVKHPAEVAERARLEKERTKIREKINGLNSALIERPERTGELRPRLRQLQEIEISTNERIKNLDSHYEAWHATRVKTADDTFQIVAELADLPTALPGNGKPGGWGAPATVTRSDRPASLKDLWERYGLTVTAHWAVTRSTERNDPPADAEKVFTRRAEDVTLSVVEHRNGVPVITTRSRHFVADEFSPVDSFKIKKSLFGRRSLDLTFTPQGYPSGVGVEGASAMAELAKSVAQVPANLATGVESYTKLTTGLASARRAGLDAELARVKAEVELRQQKLTAAGLDVTGTDAAELDRLTQLQSILESQAAIRDIDPTLVEALRERAKANLSWYQPPPPAPKEDQTLTIILKQAETEPGAATVNLEPGVSNK